MAGIQRSSAAVYAADGAYLGHLLQCDHQFMVIAKSWWRLDFYVVPYEEVAEEGGSILVLRCLADDIRLETAGPWSPPPDPLGNANGVDLEPLRAGMAELEGAVVAAGPEARAGSATTTSRPDPPFPSPEDIYRLDGERIARLHAQADRYIAAEIEDLLIAASCETPPGFEHVASYEGAFALGATSPARRRPALGPPEISAVHAPGSSARVQRSVVPQSRVASLVGDEAARDPKALGRILSHAGFSPAEAEAIASCGYEALARLRSAAPPPAAAPRQGGGESVSVRTP